MRPEDLLAEVRRQAVGLARESWAELGRMVEAMLPEPMDPVALLPVATGSAVGAAPGELIPVAGAVLVMAVALRILDDCADQDNPRALYRTIGLGRAINITAALFPVAVRGLAQLPLPGDQRDALLGEYLQAVGEVCQGQDRDLRGRARSLDEYRRVVQGKTVAAYAFAAAAGARAAGADRAALARARQCGAHLGWMVQILDDIEAQWFPDGPSDLSRGRLTFPALHGLSLARPAAAELRRLCAADALDQRRIMALLDEMEVRVQLMTEALDHRDRALEALGSPLDPDGQAMLQLWLDWIWRDAERLLGPLAPGDQ